MTGGKPERKARRKAERKANRKAQRSAPVRGRLTACGHCGTTIHDLSSLAGELPEPGLWCVCVRCGGVNELDSNFALVAISQADVADTLPAAAREVLTALQVNVQMRMFSSIMGTPIVVGQA